MTIPVGLGVSDVQAVDTTGSGRLDLVVTNKLTGQVSVLHNLGDGTFAAPVPYRAGTGLSAIDPGSTPEVTSLEATAGVAAGPLTPGGPTSLVTINPGSNTLDVLAGLGGGRFANPVTIQTASPAQVVRMADFTGNGIDDLAVLTADGVSIYLGNGKGGFLPPTTYAGRRRIRRADRRRSDGKRQARPLGRRCLWRCPGAAGQRRWHLPALPRGQPGHRAGRGRPHRQRLQGRHLRRPGPGPRGRRLRRGQIRPCWPISPRACSTPGAVTLADLNGNGIPDLIVANSGSNNVLIYPGLGNGQFGPAINGGHGYFVGTNPVGITVANLTGALPDLVVADKGSNEVSILVNQSQGGDISASRRGLRLNSGGTRDRSPRSSGTFTGSVYPDLLVSNSGSNNVTLLPGLGPGFFNDQNPRTFPVGDNPGPIFVGNFDGQTDLVTVNAGSNDLTLISGFMGADSVTTTISSGGIDPATAFGFSSGSAFDDLVVGNGGDGVLALFEGSDEGLTLTSGMTNPDLPSPSALVFAGLAGGDVQFYAASAGREAAVLVALSLGGEIAPLSPLPSPTPTVAQLVPLQESSLALVGTFLITTLPSSGTEVNLGPAETEVAITVSLSTTGPVALGQSAAAQSRGEETEASDDETPAQPEPAKAGVEPSAASWQHRVLGTDEALERFDHEHPDLSRPGREASPETNPSQRHGAIPAPAQENPPPGQGHPATADRLLEAVDGAIDHLHDGQQTAIEGQTDRTASGKETERKVGETHQEINRIKIRLVGFTRPTTDRVAVNEERDDLSAALALAATVAGEFYFRSAGRRNSPRSRRRIFPR